jgi:hypothetical protein
MKYIILLICIFSLTNSYSAQNISGKIIDSLSGELEPMVLGHGTMFVYQEENTNFYNIIFTRDCELSLSAIQTFSVPSAELGALLTEEEDELRLLAQNTISADMKIIRYYELYFCDDLTLL